MIKNIEEKNKRVQNFLKATFFNEPKWIPCKFCFYNATWMKYGQKLEDIILNYPDLFPDYKKRRNYTVVKNKMDERGEFVDQWGCTWKNINEGLHSAIVGHPLASWDDFDNYVPPDPLTDGNWDQAPNWEKVKKQFEESKDQGYLAVGHIPHGSMYMRLHYLRGFENLMIDIATKDPRLEELIEMVLNYNIKLIKKYLDLGVEFIYFGDDLGMQDRLPFSIETFKEYFKPCYDIMFSLCQKRGVGVYLHSDGHILEIIPELVDSGVDIINPQFGANDLKQLKDIAKGRVCIDILLDEQIFPWATPAEIKNHINEVVKELNSPKGGLMLYPSIEPDVPLENIETMCNVLNEIGGPTISI